MVVLWSLLPAAVAVATGILLAGGTARDACPAHNAAASSGSTLLHIGTEAANGRGSLRHGTTVPSTETGAHRATASRGDAPKEGVAGSLHRGTVALLARRDAHSDTVSHGNTPAELSIAAPRLEPHQVAARLAAGKMREPHQEEEEEEQAGQPLRLTCEESIGLGAEDVVCFSLLKNITPFNPVAESKVLFGMLIGAAAVIVMLGSKGESAAQPQRIEGWTGFRCLLALWIFLEHHKVHPMIGSGSFLLLSGAMLALSKRDVASVDGYVTFLVRRLARIYPAYWCAMSAFLAVRDRVSPLKAILSMPFEHPGLFLAVQPWMEEGKLNRLWFIGTIIELYAMFPLLSLFMSWLGTRKSATKCAILAGACYVAQWAIALYAASLGYDGKSSFPQILGMHIRMYTNPFVRSPQFVMGMTLGHMVQATSGTEGSEQRMPGWATDVAAVAVVAIAVLGKVLDVGSTPATKVFNDFFLFSPAIYLLLLGVVLSDQASMTCRFFVRTPIRLLGKWSYGIYLWNLFITVSHTWWPHESAWGIVTDYAFCLVASAISFLLVEEPAQKMVDWTLDASRKLASAGRSELHEHANGHGCTC